MHYRKVQSRYLELWNLPTQHILHLQPPKTLLFAFSSPYAPTTTEFHRTWILGLELVPENGCSTVAHSTNRYASVPEPWKGWWEKSTLLIVSVRIWVPKCSNCLRQWSYMAAVWAAGPLPSDAQPCFEGMEVIHGRSRINSGRQRGMLGHFPISMSKSYIPLFVIALVCNSLFVALCYQHTASLMSFKGMLSTKILCIWNAWNYH